MTEAANVAVKMWQEPNGYFTMMFYRTKEMVHDDYIEMSDISEREFTEQGQAVVDWLKQNSPPEHGAEFTGYVGMIQWNERGGDTALLCKLAFS